MAYQMLEVSHFSESDAESNVSATSATSGTSSDSKKKRGK
jgi:hypothetical protein